MNPTPEKKPYPFGWPGYKPAQPRRPKKPRRKQGRLTACDYPAHNAHAFDASKDGFDSPQHFGATTASSTSDMAFFYARNPSIFMVECAGTLSSVPVPKCRSVNPAHSATQSFDSDRGGYQFPLWSHPMNTLTTQATPEIRPDFAPTADNDAVETRPSPHASLPDIISCIDDFDLALSKFESVLGLLLQSLQQGEWSGGLDGVLSALEFLAENANAEYLKLCGAIPQIEAEQPAAHLKRAGAVIEECRAVLWILVDYCGSNRDSRCPHKTHSALSAAGSLSKLAGLEIGQFWALLRETLVLEICAGNGKEDKTHAAG